MPPAGLAQAARGDARSLLTLLQFGDSFFPSGATAYSFGLEALRMDGAVPDERAVEEYVRGQLRERWAGTDRIAVSNAHAAHGDQGIVSAIDDLVDRSTVVGSWRTAGRRLGSALLRSHGALGTPGATEYAARVRAGAAAGQASAVQGLLAFASGLDADEAAVLSAYGLVMGIAGAALRLGLMGHLGVQGLIARQRDLIAQIIAEAAPLQDMNAWVPQTEIAAMRHETAHARLFAT